MDNMFIRGAYHPHADPELIQQTRRWTVENPWHVIRPFYRQMQWNLLHAPRGRDGPAVVDEIRCPVRIMHGESDGFIPREDSERLGEEVRRRSGVVCVWEEVAEASHQLMEERPDIVNAALDQMIDTIRQGGGGGGGGGGGEREDSGDDGKGARL